MTVLIIGAGAVGIAVAATLVESGCEVDFIARGKTKEAICENGIKRTGLFGDITVPAGVITCYEDYAELPADRYDYVVIASKTTADAEIAEKLGERKDCMKEGGVICFMQNGIGYEQEFLDDFDENELYQTRVITGFIRPELNVSEVTVHQAPFMIGSVYGNDLEVVKPLAEALDKSGIPAVVDEDVQKALWAKLIYNTVLNPLGALLNMSYGELSESSYAHALMDNLIEEAFEVMNAAGATTYWPDAESYRKEFFGKLVPDTYNHRSSTLQDIERRQKTEIDYITGGMLNVASQYEVSAPVNSMLYWLIKAKEESFEN